MARKRFELHPDIGSGRVGLAVVNGQPLHRGPIELLSRLRETCDTAIVAIGSASSSGTNDNPFTFEQRKAMIEGIFGDVFRIIPLDDVTTSDDLVDWADYVLQKVRSVGQPAPTDYFCGSEVDARWYVHHFLGRDPGQSLARVNSTVAGGKTTYRSDFGRRLHIVDRVTGGDMAGRDIRVLIEARSDEWRPFVPERLHNFIERQYPAERRRMFSATALAKLAGTEEGNFLKLCDALTWDKTPSARTSGSLSFLLGAQGILPIEGTRLRVENAFGKSTLMLGADDIWHVVASEDDR